MANQVRNRDFVQKCKDLYTEGYTMKQIAEKLRKVINRPTLCRRTVFNAIHLGIKPV